MKGMFEVFLLTFIWILSLFIVLVILSQNLKYSIEGATILFLGFFSCLLIFRERIFLEEKK